MNEFLLKFQRLSLLYRLAILIALVLLIYCAYFFFVYSPAKQETQVLIGKKRQLTVEIGKLQALANKLPRYRDELANLNAQLSVALKKLPNEQEIPELLKRISTVGTQAGLEFQMFQPGQEQRKDFFAEVPITLRVNGSYHELGVFFDRLGKLQRIINISNFKLSSPKERDNKMVLNADIQAMTFRFIDK